MQRYPSLSKKQRTVAEYILAHPDEICYLTLRELCLRTNCSEVTILRLCAALDLSGYTDLRLQCRQFSREQFSASFPDSAVMPAKQSDTQNILRDIAGEELSRIIDFVRGLDVDKIRDLSISLMNANEVIIFGHEVSKVFADYFFQRLTFLRIISTSMFMNSNVMVNSTAARLKKGDVAIFFSFPPYYQQVGQLSQRIHAQGADVVVITDAPNSPAIVDGCSFFTIPTATRFFYNSHTVVPAFINIVASGIAYEMGDRYRAILASEHNLKINLENDTGEV